jgi:competence protein ComEC
MGSQIFFSVILGFLFGNIAGSRLGLSVPESGFLLMICLAVLAFARLRGRSFKVFSRHFLIAIIGLSAFALGVLRYAWAEESLQSPELAGFEGQTVEMIGKVLNEPVRKTDLARLNIEISAVASGSETKRIEKEKISVYVDFFAAASYGDVVIIRGKLERIKNREEATNFDFEAFAKKDGIQFQMFRPALRIEKNIGNPVILKLKTFKNFFENKLSEHLSEPHASLVAGMLISGKNALPKDIQEDFIRTGVIHIVVLSGFNIAIIIRFLGSLFSIAKLNRRVSFVLILGILTLFVLMAGATPPVIRAVLMASIVLMGKATYRQMDANKVLLFVAFILALINPYSAPFDPSFQLSFIATFAIINLAPILERYFRFIRSDVLRETVSQTLAATIFVSPFILYLMGNFSVVALLVNVIILPFVPILMLFGFLLVALSFIPFVPALLAFVVVALSSFVFFIVHFASSLPFASFSISSLPFILILPIYALIFWFMYRKKREVPIPVIDSTLPH